MTQKAVRNLIFQVSDGLFFLFFLGKRLILNVDTFIIRFMD